MAATKPAVTGAEPVATELASESLSVLAAESAAATKPATTAAEPVATVELASESLSVLAAEPVAAAESAAGLSVESAAEPAVGPTMVVQGRPMLANGPAAAPRGCWVMNSAISPKVIVKRTREGSALVAAAEAATLHERQAGEPLSVLVYAPAAGRVAAESVTSPPASVPAALAAGAQGKRKATAGAAEGSQKRKRSSPVKLKDLQ